MDPEDWGPPGENPKKDLAGYQNPDLKDGSDARMIADTRAGTMADMTAHMASMQIEAEVTAATGTTLSRVEDTV